MILEFMTSVNSNGKTNYLYLYIDTNKEKFTTNFFNRCAIKISKSDFEFMKKYCKMEGYTEV